MAPTAAEVYEAFFLPALFEQWTDRVLDAAGVSEGDRVLDVGCGTGVLARRASERVGSSGRVVGLDPNDGMLAVARRTPGVEWMTGVAEDLPLERTSFDVVVSQFAMMFFDDRRLALSEVGRVLRGGGRVAIATWASLDETPGYAAMVALLDRLFGRGAGDALRVPYILGDQGDLHDLLSCVFADVAVTKLDGTARFDSIEAWVHTDIRGWTLSEMSDRDYGILLEAAHAELARFTDDQGRVTFPAPALVCIGTAGS